MTEQLHRVTPPFSLRLALLQAGWLARVFPSVCAQWLIGSPRGWGASLYWSDVHSWVPQPGESVPNSIWGLSIENEAAQLSLIPFQALFGPSFTSLSFSLFLALCWIPAALSNPVFCAAGIKPSAFIAPESSKWDSAIRNPPFLHMPVLSGAAAPSGCSAGEGMLSWAGASPHGYQAVGKARCRRGWRSWPGRTQTKEPALSTAARRQRIRLLRDLANSLEHWALAGTHPSLHERGSVFYSFKQLRG